MARWSRTLQSGYICLGYILPLSGAALGIVFVAINGAQNEDFLLGNHPCSSRSFLFSFSFSFSCSLFQMPRFTKGHSSPQIICEKEQPYRTHRRKTSLGPSLVAPQTHYCFTPPPFRTRLKTLSPGSSSGSKFGPRSIPVTVGSRTVWEDGPPEYYLLSFWLFTCLQVRASSTATTSTQCATHTNTRTARSHSLSHPNAIGFRRMPAFRSRTSLTRKYTPISHAARQESSPSLHTLPHRKLIITLEKKQ